MQKNSNFCKPLQELLLSHPLLMHVLVASMTKDKIESIQVQMSDFKGWLAIAKLKSLSLFISLF